MFIFFAFVFFFLLAVPVDLSFQAAAGNSRRAHIFAEARGWKHHYRQTVCHLKARVVVSNSTWDGSLRGYQYSYH
jgi:hypothetical protein